MKFHLSAILACVTALFALPAVAAESTFVPELLPVGVPLQTQKLDWQPSDAFSRIVKSDGGTYFVTEVPAAQKSGHHWVSAKIDTSVYAGKKICFLIRYRASGLSKPSLPYLGFKFMLTFRSAPGGEVKYESAPLNDGKSDGEWRYTSICVDFGKEPQPGTLSLGMQDISGKVEFDFDSLQVGRIFSPEQRINMDYRIGYPERVGDRTRLRGVMSPGRRMTVDDFETLKSWNVNLVRSQIIRNWAEIGTDLDLEEYDRWFNKRLDEIAADCELARKYGIRFVIDLHSPPGGSNGFGKRMLFEQKYADHFIKLWERIATRFKGNPRIHAYDLINEPGQSMPAQFDYWNLQRMAAEKVRSIDPDTPIMIASGDANIPDSFRYLSPLRMDNVIYQVHMYFPLSYTHQRLGGVGPVGNYPGVLEGELWNRERIRAELAPVREFQLRHNAKIYVGEFSAIVWAPGAEKYIADCIDVFEEYGWDWTFHAFREWSGWSVEHDGTGPGDLSVSKTPTLRKQTLLKYLERNQREQ